MAQDRNHGLPMGDNAKYVLNLANYLLKHRIYLLPLQNTDCKMAYTCMN